MFVTSLTKKTSKKGIENLVKFHTNSHKLQPIIYCKGGVVQKFFGTMNISFPYIYEA